ncbi:aminoglycoside phosphotransferase family protein [Sphingobacterium oryzagri]|uniref:Aminoglycoside phosphotransferase family protein n=1 Tax=Sphingobacterium oryzagri TaxID=3025669 RepID=A0ABY7WFJ0_9SPHI|nr:aminoglycoside phosphotransferase family protein [Sphingobacterium sp. KACC 22765]WDF67242.1 aminoglycoside phosphotransferase family protein [Sphingobacterium sp. KACC 22765]
MLELNRSTLINSASQFAIDGDVDSLSRFGSGHINDTFRVKTNHVSGRSYLLQRINNQIFADVDGLMRNTNIVLEHLKKRLAVLGEDMVEKSTLTLIPTKTGSLYFDDTHGGYWRMFILLEGTKSYDIVETPEQAYAGGQAFGKFQKLLADLDANKLVEILPNFHNLDFRMHNLRLAIAADTLGRVQEVEDLLDFIMDRERPMRAILTRASNGELPLRITHNDTKFNNILLDQDDQVQCVIDLDTVMPGYVAYDFGDAIRTIINSAAEDEADLEKIKLNIPLFRAYTEGYIMEAKDFLTEPEIESLLEGVFLLPFMQAIRFLTDYLNGDTYYKIHYPLHNLVRTRAQVKLVQEMENHVDELAAILSSSVNTHI